MGEFVFLQPTGENETVFAKRIVSKDKDSIVAACDLVKKFFDDRNDMEKILHIGVGVGNPMACFGNPSMPDTAVKEKMIISQMQPGFLREAAGKGMAVAAINFNGVESSSSIQDNMYTLNVQARFPLIGINEEAAEENQALRKVAEIKAMADRFSIMNSVANFHYPPLLLLASLFVPAGKTTKSAYLYSFAETGEAFAFINPKFYWNRRSFGGYKKNVDNDFSDLATVFDVEE